MGRSRIVGNSEPILAACGFSFDNRTNELIVDKSPCHSLTPSGGVLSVIACFASYQLTYYPSLIG